MGLCGLYRTVWDCKGLYVVVWGSVGCMGL